jgi:acetyl esterase/lipase
MKLFFCILVALGSGVSLAAGAQSQSGDSRRDPRVAEYFAMVKRHVRYPIREHEIVVHRDMAAGRRSDGTTLTLDLSLPRRASPRAIPVVLMVHGGIPDEAPIRPTQWQMYQDWGAILAQAGIAGVMFNHRLGAPQHRLTEATTEVQTVLRWVEDHAAEYGFTKNQVCLMTFSAGALLVPEILRKDSERVIRSVVMFYPLLGDPSGQESAKVDSSEVQSQLQFQGVLDLLARNSTPVLLLRAGHDQVPGLLDLLDQDVSAALKADVNLSLVNVPGVPHAFDSLVDGERTREAVSRALAFVRAGFLDSKDLGGKKGAN